LFRSRTSLQQGIASLIGQHWGASMIRVVNDLLRRKSYSLCGVLAAMGIAALSARPAHAVPPSPVAFTMTMSPYARTLNALEEFGPMSPEFMEVWKEDSWDNPHLRVRARNKPAIMIVNENNSVAPLTTFTLEINNPGPFFFGMGDFATDNFVGFIQNTIYTDPGVTITGSSVSGDGKTLMVNFDGLTAGRKAIFNIDLDSSDPGLFPFPDYRLVLCGAPSGPGDPSGLPATISATFTDASSPPPNTTTLTMDLSGAIDPITGMQVTPSVPEFFEQNIRPAKLMEMNEIKEKFIPEPSSAMLALAGVAGLAALRRHRRIAA